MKELAHKQQYTMQDLLDIVALLRDPVHGCPWDKVQTHESIRKNLIEETYEVADAIDLADTHLLCEELGDVLLQVALHTRMEQERGTFTFEDVCTGICKKLIYRHPHIFGDVPAHSTEEILNNWDELKKKEKSQDTVTDGLESVARSLPGLIRADKIQKKAAKAGFDWDSVAGAAAKVREELDEALAVPAGSDAAEDEVGDLLFAAVNVARFLKVEPEHAMERACDKFIRRFAGVEAQAQKAGKELAEMSLAELEELWQRAKAETGA